MRGSKRLHKRFAKELAEVTARFNEYAKKASAALATVVNLTMDQIGKMIHSIKDCDKFAQASLVKELTTLSATVDAMKGLGWQAVLPELAAAAAQACRGAQQPNMFHAPII